MISLALAQPLLACLTQDPGTSSSNGCWVDGRPHWPTPCTSPSPHSLLISRAGSRQVATPRAPGQHCQQRRSRPLHAPRVQPHAPRVQPPALRSAGTAGLVHWDHTPACFQAYRGLPVGCTAAPPSPAGPAEPCRQPHCKQVPKPSTLNPQTPNPNFNLAAPLSPRHP